MIKLRRSEMTIQNGPSAFLYWTTKATDTLSEYVILIALPGSNDCTYAPQCYVVLTLPVLLDILLYTNTYT